MGSARGRGAGLTAMRCGRSDYGGGDDFLFAITRAPDMRPGDSGAVSIANRVKPFGRSCVHFGRNNVYNGRIQF